MRSKETPEHVNFFRQSGWLMIANVVGGFFMYSVHFLNRELGQGQYGEFVVLLAVAMLVPTIPVQMILAQQTAKALATERRGELAGLIRWLLLATSLLWFLAVIPVFIFRDAIVQHWQMSGPLALWITMVIVLLSLWMPIFLGVLQGKQNFLWLGWTMMSNAFGRISIAAFAVLVLRTDATGMMVGVLAGIAVAVALGAWHSRSLWLAKPEPFDWRNVLQQIVPLFIAFLAFQMLFTADTLFVKWSFGKADADFYGSAGTLSRALMWLVLPLASVMFPRLVHSAARSEKSNLGNLVLIGTAVLALLGAAATSVLGRWVVAFVYNADVYVAPVTSLLPWYVFAMVPLSVANVLLNNLLAKPASKWRLAFAVLAVALAYLYAITWFHSRMQMVVQTMGVANLVLLAVCGWVTWRGDSSACEATSGSTR